MKATFSFTNAKTITIPAICSVNSFVLLWTINAAPVRKERFFASSALKNDLQVSKRVDFVQTYVYRPWPIVCATCLSACRSKFVCLNDMLLLWVFPWLQIYKLQKQKKGRERHWVSHSPKIKIANGLIYSLPECILLPQRDNVCVT